jgi:hypothetical protein
MPQLFVGGGGVFGIIPFLCFTVLAVCSILKQQFGKCTHDVTVLFTLLLPLDFHFLNAIFG